LSAEKLFTHVKHDGNPSLPMGFAATADWAEAAIAKQSGPFIVVRGPYTHTVTSRAEAAKLVREVLGKVAVGVSVHVRSASSSEMLKMRRIPIVPSYLDPFRDANISAARINGGVDYCGSGPVYPIGNAVILNVGRPSGTSTFGSDMAVYELLDGPGRGLKVFFAEHYRTRGGYANGDHVTVDDVLWDMYSCIEIGWSDGRGSVAWDSASHSIEGERTAYGENMNDLLVALGSVAGLATGRPITMLPLPAAYPKDWKKALAA
jgi:hypothetical protein